MMASESSSEMLTASVKVKNTKKKRRSHKQMRRRTANVRVRWMC